jgi:hypothetical protein
VLDVGATFAPGRAKVKETVKETVSDFSEAEKM